MRAIEPAGAAPSASTDYSDTTSTFGDRITLAREAHGIEQDDLAEKLGIKIRTLKNWEEDRAEPRANKLQMLAGLLNVSMIWLMSGRGEQPDFVGTDTVSLVQECLADLRTLQTEQRQISERMFKLERRLRLAFDGVETG
jgi:HTH-type transcriptional regulator, cell division transcriptional repressor